MIHTNLPIYKKGYDLLSLAADVQLNMPRTFKQSLGKRVHDECVDLLLEIGYANASRGEKRCDHIRYVDDFVLLHESAQWLNDARHHIEQHLDMALAARLNPKKTILQPIERGIDFVGQVIKPWRRVTRRKTFNEALRRVRTIDQDKLFETANSYFGLLRQSTSSHHDRATLSNELRARGHSIKSDLTKTFRAIRKNVWELGK